MSCSQRTCWLVVKYSGYGGRRLPWWSTKTSAAMRSIYTAELGSHLLCNKDFCRCVNTWCWPKQNIGSGDLWLPYENSWRVSCYDIPQLGWWWFLIKQYEPWALQWRNYKLNNDCSNILMQHSFDTNSDAKLNCFIPSEQLAIRAVSLITAKRLIKFAVMRMHTFNLAPY